MTNQPRNHLPQWTGILKLGKIGVLMLGLAVLKTLPTQCQSVKTHISGRQAAIPRRSELPLRLAEYNPWGMSLRYYREIYPETTCYLNVWGITTCEVGGEIHLVDVYFPRPELRWI